MPCMSASEPLDALGADCTLHSFEANAGFIRQQRRQCGQQAFEVKLDPLHTADRLLLCTELIMQEFTSIVMLGLTLLGLRAAHSCNIAIAHKPAGSAKHAVSQRMMRTLLYFVCAVVQVSAAATWLYFSIVLPPWFNAQPSPSDNILVGCTSRTHAIVLKLPMLASGKLLPSLACLPVLSCRALSSFPYCSGISNPAAEGV